MDIDHCERTQISLNRIAGFRVMAGGADLDSAEKREAGKPIEDINEQSDEIELSQPHPKRSARAA